MDKTEQPTPRKLREARRRGEVPRSRELGTAAVLLAAAGVLAATGASALDSLVAAWELSLAAIGGELAAGPTTVLEGALVLGLHVLFPVLVVVVGAGFLASFLQVGALFTTEPITPKASRLSFVQGLRRLFSQRQLVEVLKSVFQILIIGAVAYLTLRDALRGVVGLAARDAEAALSGTGHLVVTLVLRAGVAIAAVALVDVIYQRWRHIQDQKMTREELKRERRETEGDPHARHARERMHREILAHSAIEETRTADVLVTHATRLAVALRYDEEGDGGAPEVRAKGRDELAERMLAAARQVGVPVVEEVAVAHALFEVEEGTEIPEALYENVAVVLRSAWREAEGEA